MHKPCKSPRTHGCLLMFGEEHCPSGPPYSRLTAVPRRHRLGQLHRSQGPRSAVLVRSWTSSTRLSLQSGCCWCSVLRTIWSAKGKQADKLLPFFVLLGDQSHFEVSEYASSCVLYPRGSGCSRPFLVSGLHRQCSVRRSEDR